MDEALQVHENRAAQLLAAEQYAAVLAELEHALCLASKLAGPSTAISDDSKGDLAGLSLLAVRFRWQQLASSAVSWSFDLMADPTLWSEKYGGGEGKRKQVLDMLSFAEMLTRPEVAKSFGGDASDAQPFLRALTHAGLGSYYRLRHNPQAAVRSLEQAAHGYARWAHPAILLNLSAALSLIREGAKSLSTLNQALLAMRSSTGQLGQMGISEVEAACKAAEVAVQAVLGCPTKAAEEQNARMTGAVQEAFSAEFSARPDNTEIAVARTLLVAKVLLWPWPEFREEEAVASTSVADPAPDLLELDEDGISSAPPKSDQQELERSTPKVRQEDDMRLRQQAASGIAKHAAKLRKVWPEWGHPLLAEEASEGSTALRECVLLCFLQALVALRQCGHRNVVRAWATPVLHEGLALSMVLFGPKHPLAFKLMSALRELRPVRQNHADEEGKVEVTKKAQDSSARQQGVGAKKWVPGPGGGPGESLVARKQARTPGRRLRDIPLPLARERQGSDVHDKHWVGYIGKPGLVNDFRGRLSGASTPDPVLQTQRPFTPTGWKANSGAGTRPRSSPATRSATPASAPGAPGGLQELELDVVAEPAADQLLSPGRAPRSRGVTLCHRAASPPSPHGTTINQPQAGYEIPRALRTPGDYRMWNPGPALGGRSHAVASKALNSRISSA